MNMPTTTIGAAGMTVSSTRRGGAHRSKSDSQIKRLLRRAPEALTTLGLVAVAFLQRPGQIVRDTKLDLSVDPGRFLSRATHLWDPNVGFGSIPNQAFGYFFPMGPFYWLGSALHVPVWIVQRAWLALLFSVAFWGLVLLADVLQIGGRWSRVAGGIAFALSPLILAQSHDTAYVMPAVLLPWVMIPLVKVDKGTLLPAAGAARSGMAVLFMGGVNASATAAVLLLPIVWFFTRRPVLKQTKLFLLWIIAVVLATAWFFLPLLFQAKYWFNAVPYTESSHVTTAVSSIAETLRGAGIWTSFSLVPIWSTAGHLIESNPAVIVSTSLVAGAGLCGLASHDMPHRKFFSSVVLIGIVVVSSGYLGHLGGPLASEVRGILDGKASAFRNVAKFQPLITLALVLGLVHALERLFEIRRNSEWQSRNTLFVGFNIALIATIALASAPAITGQVYPEGSFKGIPSYWHQAIDWLNTRGGMSNTLLIPGSDFADLTWGNPLDQPIQPLSTVPWANRAVTPLGSIGNTQFLDSIDRLLADGQAEPGFSDYLARAGVRYLLVENDLELKDTNGPSAVAVRLVLGAEPGLNRVARFGPVVRHPNSGVGTVGVYDPKGLTRGIHSLEIYRVLSTSAGDALVTTYPLSTGIRLSGGPQGELKLADYGLLTHQAVTLTSDPLGPRFDNPQLVVTDTQQLRATQFSNLYENSSYLLSPGESVPGAAGPPNQWIVVPGVQHETVSKLIGALSVSASSYGPLFTSVPGDQPLAAFLKDSGGAMWEASPNDRRPWIEIRFNKPIPIREVTISTPKPNRFQTQITRVQIETDRGRVRSKLQPSSSTRILAAPKGETRFLKVTLVGLDEPKSSIFSGPAISHIGIPNFTVSQSWVVPNDGASGSNVPPDFLFNSPIPNQFAFFSGPDDEVTPSRTFNVPRSTTFLVGGEVTPLHSSSIYSHENPPIGQGPPSSAILRFPYILPCGSGPTLTLDGRQYATAVFGTGGDLYALTPMTMKVCTPEGAWVISPGTHSVIASDAQSAFKVTSLLLFGSGAQQSHAPRSIAVRSWGSQARTLIASAGPAAILNLHQNFSSGWLATVNGHQLRPVRLDGWQQGWILPASTTPQVVVMRFGADHNFRLSIALGGALALTLAAWSFLPTRRPRKRFVGVNVDGINADVAEDTGYTAVNGVLSTHPNVKTGAACLLLTAGLFLIAGPVSVAVVCLMAVRWMVPKCPWLLPSVALIASVMAGISIALDPTYLSGPWIGNGSYSAQALSGIALAALGANIIGHTRPERAG
jgi:arabinofuranan 3-O-arabinosyltransferase